MKKPKIDKENYKKLTITICDHMKTEHDFHIGQFEAESLLDEMLKIIIPSIYNQAMNDATAVLKSVTERMEEELDIRKII